MEQFSLYEWKTIRQALLIDFLSDEQGDDKDYKKEILDKIDSIIQQIN